MSAGGHQQATGGALAFAAVCLLGLAAAGCSAAPPATEAGQPAPLRAMQPAGATSFPFDFTWAGSGSNAVRIRVFDEAERQLYGLEARGSRVPAPEELGKLLEPGARYLWRVTRIDQNGDETDGSDLMAFSVR